MEGKYKSFDKELFNIYDKDARWAVTNYLANTYGYVAIDNPDTYGPDLIIEDSSGLVYIEVEVCKSWRFEPNVPFNPVNIPERKAKFLSYQTIEFWLLNRYLDRAVIIGKKSMTQDRVAESANRFNPAGEFFFKIPRQETKLVYLAKR